MYVRMYVCISLPLLLLSLFLPPLYIRSPMAICLLIRYIQTLLQDDPSGQNARTAYQFLEGSLRHKNEMVIYEAAKVGR